MALIGGHVEPSHRFGLVPGRTCAVGEHCSEVELSLHVSLFGGFSVPVDRLGIVPRDTLATGVDHPEIELRERQALFRGLDPPVHRFALVPGNTLAVVVCHREVELRPGVSLLGGHTEPSRRHCLILRHAVASEVHPSEEVLRMRVPRGSLFLDQRESLFVEFLRFSLVLCHSDAGGVTRSQCIETETISHVRGALRMAEGQFGILFEAGFRQVVQAEQRVGARVPVLRPLLQRSQVFLGRCCPGIRFVRRRRGVLFRRCDRVAGGGFLLLGTSRDHECQGQGEKPVEEGRGVVHAGDQ